MPYTSGVPESTQPQAVPEEAQPANWDNNDTSYQMPAFAGRNILVFSDGTGQAGGLQVDEFRSNVYKLFRATRCGPDTTIDPDRQLAFYDPGLGSKLAGDDIKVPFMWRIYNGLSSATGPSGIQPRFQFRRAKSVRDFVRDFFAVSVRFRPV
jgi:hypothetical protein